MFPSLWVHSVFSGLAKNTHLLSVVTAGGGMHVDNQAVDAKKKKKVITHRLAGILFIRFRIMRVAAILLNETTIYLINVLTTRTIHASIYW